MKSLSLSTPFCSVLCFRSGSNIQNFPDYGTGAGGDLTHETHIRDECDMVNLSSMLGRDDCGGAVA